MTVPASVAPNPEAFSRRGVNRLSFLELGGEDRPEQRLKHRIVGDRIESTRKATAPAKGTEGASNNRETWTAQLAAGMPPLLQARCNRRSDSRPASPGKRKGLTLITPARGSSQEQAVSLRFGWRPQAVNSVSPLTFCMVRGTECAIRGAQR